IGVGDGGDANDPLMAGQDLNTLLGKILRIDVTPGNGQEYSIPPDNPFINQQGARPEIWATGLRNPWRFGFDPVTDVLYTGDVGQGEWEEVTVVERGGNYGWNPMEGFHCFSDNTCDESAGPNQVNADGYTMPIAEYDHGEMGGKSITGGNVYRSCEVPGWAGKYFYADFVSNRIWWLDWNGQDVNVETLGLTPGDNPSSFGTNAWGDVYMTVFGGFGGGEVYRVVPQP
ncbi:MAG: PQQ-dependent sugar dehydrogenase, partial [Nannocystaceae bacterium]